MTDILETNMPGATIVSVKQAGVGTNKTEVVLIVSTAEQGEVALKIPIADVLQQMISALQGLKHEVRAIATAEFVEAALVQRYGVASVKSQLGVLLSFNPDTPQVQTFMFPPATAIDAGLRLMQEGGRQSSRKRSTIIHNSGAGKLLDHNGRPVKA